MKGYLLFFFVCCNGLLDLFKMFWGDLNIKFFWIEKWGFFYFEYIVFLFYNFEILCELMSLDNNMSKMFFIIVNIRISSIGRLILLILVVLNNIGEYSENYKENLSEIK